MESEALLSASQQLVSEMPTEQERAEMRALDDKLDAIAAKLKA
jgi:hypothetical protein